FKYEYKIFIIDEPILPAAQNALLKTIEEPAPYGIFLFIARNTHDFLPTVLSRCVVQKFRGFSDFRGENSFLQSLAEEIADSVKGADIPEAFSLYKKIEHLEKNELQKFLDLLYIHCGKKFRQNINQKFEFEELIKTKKILSQNGNAQLAIELMLLKMR
ncbi:MAG: hypothetical protein LBI27_04585, partial [Clostridiales bacterium]|nr:hypothetical protein [Clostridiales bacterium]